MSVNRQSGGQGFTLIELLIVIGIIGFLAAAILVAVDPVKRIQDARNAKRWSEVNSILNAILNNQVDNVASYTGKTGALIATTDAVNVQVIVSDQVIPAPVSAPVDCSVQATAPACPGHTLSSVGKNCIADLSTLTPTYIAEIPIDPLGAGEQPTAGNLKLGVANTGYYIHETSNRIEVGACYPDQGKDVKVSR